MIPDTSSRAEENAELQRQLATANERLERAQSVIFALHCSVARKDERGLWMREKDRSGLRAAVWEETEDLGDWQYIKVSRFLMDLSSPSGLDHCVQAGTDLAPLRIHRQRMYPNLRLHRSPL